uniref:60S ribosomal protein L32 n=1 Tax=Percolomonas cosmopolitus TaxID=63605 RepID=A0A7S1KMQ7_9EUKA|mmetsp:Transcript_1307/g.4489  ORF Transcript_1307/g.4489 Transcript_1307/m.4489 type:complete len:135 (+) Transcript_1307:109-513(+)|eukprot:CAMPEP_0117445826 /NCGR_PEP_ID=MMETSP0759-20121206/6006_1 /TAXON_ID=63605 /ORGANISM="Percolomonas cosmopolitus, Strain WS" /LENGTH=134 /DNA_ID=CAMNT_0005238035 /DNA_START=105 /DNA_END=509 /DNA_ORIENTATION=+
MPKANIRPSTINKKKREFPRWQSNRFLRISKTGWRRPKGIDNPLRRGFRNKGIMPNLRFRTANATKFADKKNGFIHFKVTNVADVDALLMHNRKYAVEIGSSVGRALKTKIIQRCRELDLHVTNARGLVAEEHE